MPRSAKDLDFVPEPDSAGKGRTSLLALEKLFNGLEVYLQQHGSFLSGLRLPWSIDSNSSLAALHSALRSVKA